MYVARGVLLTCVSVKGVGASGRSSLARAGCEGADVRACTWSRTRLGTAANGSYVTGSFSRPGNWRSLMEFVNLVELGQTPCVQTKHWEPEFVGQGAPAVPQLQARQA